MGLRYTLGDGMSSSRINKEFAGEVLIAHPGLMDPQFKESVIFVSGHHPQVGSVGFILNRPTGKTLSQFRSSYTYSPLARVRVFQGGPVMADDVFFVAWQWFESQGRFTCQVAITEAQAGALLQGHDNHTEVWAIMGYAGWSEGQLEEELRSESWAHSKLNIGLLKSATHEKLWASYLKDANPAWWALAQTIGPNPLLN